MKLKDFLRFVDTNSKITVFDPNNQSIKFDMRNFESASIADEILKSEIRTVAPCAFPFCFDVFVTQAFSHDDNVMEQGNGFLNINEGDVVVVCDEYGHDVYLHYVLVESSECEEGLVNGSINPKGVRYYGKDLNCYDVTTDSYDSEEYISVITEGNFMGIEIVDAYRKMQQAGVCKDDIVEALQYVCNNEKPASECIEKMEVYKSFAELGAHYATSISKIADVQIIKCLDLTLLGMEIAKSDPAYIPLVKGTIIHFNTITGEVPHSL